MKIRDYKIEDLDPCVSLFDCNVPTYFHSAERNLFLDFLESSDFLPPRLRSTGAHKGHMYVVDMAWQIVGCGGWFLDDEVATLSWGMVHRSFHRSGIGRALLLKRIEAIRENGRAKSIRVKTTTLVQGFFEKAGFEVTQESVTGLIDSVPLVELRRAI